MKTIIGLTIATSLASWFAAAAGTPTVNHDTSYTRQGNTTNISGTVVTTAQAKPLTVIFTPNTLLSASATQIAAVVTVTNPTAGTEYVLGALTATGDDNTGYDTTGNTGVGIKNAQDGLTTGLANKAIVSDGTPFVVQINHKNLLPAVGATVLNVPLTAYTK